MEIIINPDLCRICLKNKGALHFYTNHGEQNVAEMISSIFNINVIHDVSLPNTICTECMKNIKIAINTKETIIKAELTINSYLKTSKTTAEAAKKAKQIEENSNVEPLDRIACKPTTSRPVAFVMLKHKTVRFLPDLSKLYNCEKCDYKVETYKQLIYHMKTHADIKLYECELCGRDYKKRSKYLLHAAVHRADKPFKCHICNKEFKGRSVLQQHVLIHNTEQSFACSKCNRSFSHMKALKQHQLIHNEKNIVCEICGKKFKHTTFLKIHKSTEHVNGRVINTA